MEIQSLKVLSRCASFELVNDTSYYSPKPFTVMLNGKNHGSYNTNVFTLFSLEPGCSYEAELIFEGDSASSISFTFETQAETVFLDAKLFGAVGDGATDCTSAFTAAIACCPAGGTIFVSEGVYMTKPLFLKSGITLYLDAGAVLKAFTQRELYPILPGMVEQESLKSEISFGTWEGNPLDSFASIITGINVEDVTIAGQGRIDASGSESDWWQNAEIRRGAWRPRTIFLNHCRDIRIVGITVGNSPAWTIHPYYCDDLDIIGVYVQNPSNSPNTDGINPESSHNVRIIGAKISVGDDCIAIKSGKYYMGVYHTRPSANIFIRNCLMERGHGGVVLGSEIASGVRDVRIQQCLMRRTDRGLRVKTRRGRGENSVVSGIVFENVVMEEVGIPFCINMFYFCDPDGHSDYVQNRSPMPVDEMTPRVKGFTCKNVRCTGCTAAGVFLYGLPEAPIDNVLLQDVSFEFMPNAPSMQPIMADGVEPTHNLSLFAENVAHIELNNVSFSGYEGEMLNLGENVNCIVRSDSEEL